MNARDRGSAITIKVEFMRNPPYGTPEYFDPTTPKISITDPAGTLRVNEASLVKDSLGKYYYICQTAVDWPVGRYSAKATGIDGSYSDVTVKSDAFVLK